VGTLDGRTSISAFPNPTTSRINLTSPSPGTWHVINNLGQTMERFTSQGHRILDCGNWPQGLYIGVFKSDFAAGSREVVRWTVTH
jgi:hypothetical protein